MTSFASQLGFLPGTLAALDGLPSDPLFGPFTEQLKSHSRTYPPVSQWGSFEADNLFVNAVQTVMKGDKPATDALAGVADAMDKAFNNE